MRTLPVVVLGLVTACASTQPGTQDSGPPVLTVDTPARGTTVDGNTVMVTGHVSGGAGAVQVTVASMPATVGTDGSFSATVSVGSGIAVLETHAIDSAAQDVRDVRAVLAGPLAPSDGTLAAPIATHANRAALTQIGNVIATDAAAVDYTAVAQGLNPIYDNGGCLGATVNITSVSLSGIDVALDPKANALGTSVTIHDVSVKLHASFKVACIGGSGTITVTSSAAHITGDLGVTVSGDKLATSLPDTAVALDDFNLSVSGIPSQVTGLFDGIVRGKVETALRNAIGSNVPGIADAKLAGLLAKPFDATILGNDLSMTISPTVASIATDGLFVAVDTNLTIANGTGGMFVTEPTTSASSLVTASHGLGLAVANDVVNQLFAGLWAANAFDQTIQLSSIPALSAFLDPNATQLAVTMSLPPTAATDPTGKLQLAIGDAMISVQDANGAELQKLALSLQTGIAITTTQSGKLALTLGTPTVFAQVIAQADDGAIRLADAQLEGIVTGVWGVVGQQASDALAKLKLPTIAGVSLGEPTVASSGNYVVADIPLQ